MSNPRIHIYAHMVYENALIAYFCQKQTLIDFRTEHVHEAFNKLAAELGYKVEKIKKEEK